MGSREPASPAPGGKGTGFVTGFVLAGGQSSRMGRNKALLTLNGEARGSGETLLDRTARLLSGVADDVVIVGDPATYGDLGYPVIADRVTGKGPLGGLDAALGHLESSAKGGEAGAWALVTACDMPGLTEEILRTLTGTVRRHPRAVAVVPETGQGLEPLCAVYHTRLLPAVRDALSEGGKKLKMKDFLEDAGHRFELVRVPLPTEPFANINTPEAWEQFTSKRNGEAA